MEEGQTDICRVCRSEGSAEKPLFHPCVCTGSIKFIHQECLLQWLKYSRKEYCELCKHRFAFTPIYSPDMPKRLPIGDIIGGLFRSIGKAVRYWLHYTLVAIAWMGVVPLTACRIYRCLFTGSVSSLLTLPLDMMSTENLLADCFQGCFVVTCTLCAFISLVWLREQILHGGGPEWLDPENHQANQQQQQQVPQPADGAPAEPVNQPEEQAANNQFEAAEEAAPPVVNQAAAEENWNPIEWDRAAEELTWERLLGLDGSLVFLEHVFWVVSLNTFFILVFAFCPYHIGHFIVLGLKMQDSLTTTQFEGLLTTFVGYLVISVSLVIMHTVAAICRFKRFKRLLGLCYVVVKVSLLVVVEIGLFPLICGWWLDICSLSMFDTSMKDREKSFRLAPGTSMFIHWLVGMVYVFYFASFILLLREVLRPGVLWFLRNLNDPDFNPIQEMIHLPMLRHIRRFLASMVIFGSTVLLMLYFPAVMIRRLFPGFLPYNVVLSSDAPVSELSLELLLLQVVLPALLEQGHTRRWLKGMVMAWCQAVAWSLDLHSYLLGDSSNDRQEQQDNQRNEQDQNAADVDNAADNVEQEPEDPHENEQPEEPLLAQQEEAEEAAEDFEDVSDDEDVEGDNNEEDEDEEAEGAPPQLAPIQGLGAAHQALLQGGGPTGFQPYNKPKYFHARLFVLFIVMCVSFFIASLISFIVPVFVGRKLMSIWMGTTVVHELYTAACGLYSCWVILRALSLLHQWLPQGYSAILRKMCDAVLLTVKSIVVAVLLIGVVPLLLGVLFEFVVVMPLRVPLNMTPVLFLWQDWALGVLHAKIFCAVTMMGPQWWLRNVIEQVYNNGLRNINLTFILLHLCAPVIGCLGLSIALPYIVAKSFVPLFGLAVENQTLILRRIYPFLLAIILFLGAFVFQLKQFKKLYEHIKNDKYLVGQRLVNYDSRRRRREFLHHGQPTAPVQ